MKCRVDGNIAAEMQAVVNALYIAHRLQLVQAADEVLIQTDCMAAIDAFEGKRRNLPAQEWEAVKVLRRLRSDHSLRVVFRHVKGHTGKKEARLRTISVTSAPKKQCAELGLGFNLEKCNDHFARPARASSCGDLAGC